MEVVTTYFQKSPRIKLEGFTYNVRNLGIDSQSPEIVTWNLCNIKTSLASNFITKFILT